MSAMSNGIVDSGPCHKCEKPILHGQGYYMMDLNVGACAAGAGNMVRCHSECFRGSVSFVSPPKTIHCGCSFLKEDDWTPATLIEPCGFHGKMAKLLKEAHRFLNAQAYTLEEMEDFCKRLDAFLGAAP